MTAANSQNHSTHINGQSPATVPKATQSNNGIATVLRKVLALLTPHERRRGVLVLLLVIVMALLETGGVASILPFLAVLGEPAMIERNVFLARAYEMGGFESTHGFLIALGAAAFCVIIVTSLTRALTIYALNRYIMMRSHTISTRLLAAYLRQPYTFFLHRNSADMSKSILSETQQLVSTVFRPASQIIAHSLVSIALVIFLIIMDPIVAVTVAAVVAVVYGLIFMGVRTFLSRIGMERLNANRARFAHVDEVLGGIKELKLLGREGLFLRRFESASYRHAGHVATAITLSLLPRNLLEAIGFGGILGLALMLMTTRQDMGEVLPILGVYAFAGYRLLPASQHIFAGFTTLRFGTATIDTLYEDLVENRAAESGQSVPDGSTRRESMPFNSALRFDGVSYRYPRSDRNVLHDLNLEIPANTTVAFVGGTGSGKTTTADLILGLLEPTAGRILIDGEPLTRANTKSWQQTVGYVPQNIYLADAAVAENIAFGLSEREIDMAVVEEVARIANIHDFVVNELPDGYQTQVGERGVRISGGQRQRIGIARALYHNPNVVVFDEATSALDNATEASVMEAVRKLSGKKTIILVAHRLSTVEKADTIYVFEQGRIPAQGRYEELLTSNPEFQRLAGTLISS